MSDDKRYSFNLDVETPWFLVTSDELDQPIEVKVRLRPGSVVITGLRIDNDREVTSTLLRFPLKEIAAELYDELRATLDQASEIESDLKRLADQAIELDWDRIEAILADAVPARPGDELLLQIYDLASAQGSLKRLKETVSRSGEDPLQSRGRGARPPSDEEYQRFAAAYKEEIVAKEWGAQSRVAKRLGMDRSTVYRWIKTCEQRGLLRRAES